MFVLFLFVFVSVLAFAWVVGGAMAKRSTTNLSVMSSIFLVLFSLSLVRSPRSGLAHRHRRVKVVFSCPKSTRFPFWVG